MAWHGGKNSLGKTMRTNLSRAKPAQSEKCWHGLSLSSCRDTLSPGANSYSKALGFLHQGRSRWEPFCVLPIAAQTVLVWGPG